MNDREKVINGLECCLEGLCDQCGYENSDGPGGCRDEMLLDALNALKDSGQNEGWLCEKRTTGSQITDLLCACGNKVYFTTLLFKDGFTSNEIHCPNCGLSMRSPGQDKDGVWLKKHWEEVVLKAPEPVEPILDSNAIEFYRCGQCNEPIDRCDNYCWSCGRAVKWG